MPVSEFNLNSLPEWYRSERETERIIEKLHSAKELDYYLRNPDEYIRRLAILRLQKLNDQNCIYVLKEVIDDPVESEENKYLAAWVLKSITKKRIGDNFISNKYLNAFNGSESFKELYSIKQEDLCPSVEFDFTSSQSYSDIQLDSDETILERDAFFESDFDLKKWFSAFGSRLIKNLLAALCAVPVFIIKLPVLIGRKIYAFLKKQSDKKRAKSKSMVITDSAIKDEEINNLRIKYSKIKHPKIHGRKEERKKIRMNTFFDSTKRFFFYIFYILFFPFRFARKHKLAIICILLAAYSLLAFTDYGRAFTNKYWSVDLIEVQNNTIQKVKDYYAYALSEFNRLSGINEWKQAESGGGLKLADVQNKADPSDPAAEKRMKYSVTAKKGLNIRELPDPNSKKVGNNSLAFGSIVIYLSKQETDASGGTWYYIESNDGRTGWVAARYLSEKKEG